MYFIYLYCYEQKIQIFLSKLSASFHFTIHNLIKLKKNTSESFQTQCVK